MQKRKPPVRISPTVSTTLPPDVVKRLDQYREQTGRTRSGVLAEALQEYFERRGVTA